MASIVTMRRVRRVLLFFAASLALLVGSTNADAADLVVDCDAGDSLQAAIDAAPDGGTVQVSGTCIGPIVIDRPVSVIGPAVVLGHYETEATRYPLTVLSGGVELTDLTVEPVLDPANPEPYGAGVGAALSRGESGVVRLTRVRVAGFQGGFGAGGAGLVVEIIDSEFTDNQYRGAYLRGVERVLVSGSTFARNEVDGLRLQDTTAVIEDSIFKRNWWSGILLRGEGSLHVEGSRIVDNHGYSGFGINGSATWDIEVDQSIVSRNSRGIVTDGALRISDSKFASNRRGGVILANPVYQSPEVPPAHPVFEITDSVFVDTGAFVTTGSGTIAESRFVGGARFFVDDGAGDFVGAIAASGITVRAGELTVRAGDFAMSSSSLIETSVEIRGADAVISDSLLLRPRGVLNTTGRLRLESSTVHRGLLTDPARATITTYGSGRTELVNVTATRNSAPRGFALHDGGGGNGGMTTIQGSILVDRSGLGGSGCGESIVSLGYNVIDVTCDWSLSPTDIGTADGLELGNLARNGGDTWTRAITADSTAYNLIPHRFCSVDTDQRGVRRPQVGRCDAGAFELEVPHG